MSPPRAAVKGQAIEDLPSAQAAVLPDDPAPDDYEEVGGGVGVPLRGSGRQLQRPALADVPDRRLLLLSRRLRHLRRSEEIGTSSCS